MTPTGRFTSRSTRHAKHRYVAIAAGSGITPVLSIVATLLEGEPGSAVTLVYANRTHRHGDVPRRARTTSRTATPTGSSLVHVLSREAQDAELFSGRLDAERLRRILDDADPGRRRRRVVPLRAAADGRSTCARPLARRSACRAAHVHTELFHVDPVPRAPVAAARRRAPEGAAHVTIKPRRPDLRRSTCAPTTYACSRRRCGCAPTCRSPARAASAAPAGRKLVEGEVAMDTNYALEPDEIERGYVLTCQSHPTVRRGRPRLRRLRRSPGHVRLSPGCRCSRCRRR